MGKFGHKGSRNAAEVYVVVWHESYRYNVVGESFHRPELRQIIAASSDDERGKGEVYTVAVLQ